MKAEEAKTKVQARGDDLEAKILAEYAQISGNALQTINETAYHPVHRFLAANIDAKGVDVPIIVDVGWGRSWADAK